MFQCEKKQLIFIYLNQSYQIMPVNLYLYIIRVYIIINIYTLYSFRFNYEKWCDSYLSYIRICISKIARQKICYNRLIVSAFFIIICTFSAALIKSQKYT